MPSARPLGVGVTVSAAPAALSSGQRRGPSIATTAVPDARDAASVPLREVGPDGSR